MEQSQEKQLIQAVKRCQQILKVYSEKITDSLQVILLIGVTGAGKSTIYNFLSGANMEIEENDDFEVQICISEQNENFSAISDGSCSVTREPIYYYNQELNHLLIDFPGFQDTRGKMEQLIIQMVFFKIVTSSPVKIVYVIRHPEKSLPDRGVGLQSFINEQFNDQNLDQSKLTLLLNCYMLINFQLKNSKKKFRLSYSKFKEQQMKILLLQKKWMIVNHQMKCFLQKKERNCGKNQLIQVQYNFNQNYYQTQKL